MNTRLLLLTGILLSGCAGLSPQELGQAHADREYQARVREELDQTREDYLAAIKKLVLAIENGTLLGSEALVIKMKLDEKAFGPPSLSEKELALYTIMVAESLDAGKITWAQFAYLVAEKESEIAAGRR